MKKKIVFLSILFIFIICIVIFNLDSTPSSKVYIDNNMEKINKNGIAVYIEEDNGNYSKTTSFPNKESGYVLNTTKSVCDGSTRISWDNNKWGLELSNIDRENMKCFLYFDKGQLFNSIILSYQSRGKISTARNGAITVDTEMENDKLYSVPDENDTTSYVYAGTNPNNYVQFGGFWWRIIRINGDGSIRLIYNGTSSAATGAGTQIQTSNATDNTVQQYNTNYNHNAYVGYMYGSTETTESTYESTHTNTTSSTIKSEVDNWYNTNLNKTGIKEKIDNNGTFCNDRVVDKTAHSSYQGDGTGTTQTGYAPLGRLYTNGWKTSQTPSLKCSQSNDLFTVNGAKTATGATKGNQALAYPVGLITSDEVVLAGGFGGTARTFWLNTGQYYWTMSPHRYPNAAVFYVTSSGGLGIWDVCNALGVRPVINLKADTVFAGDGTVDSPFEVS